MTLVSMTVHMDAGIKAHLGFAEVTLSRHKK